MKTRLSAAFLVSGIVLCAEVGGVPEPGVTPLFDGLIGYLPLDGDLRIRQVGGGLLDAEFSRHSRAYDDALRSYEPDIPRFAAGRFGQSVFVEPGFENGKKFTARNTLPTAVAEFAVDTPPGDMLRAVGGGDWRVVHGTAAAVPAGSAAAAAEGNAALLVRCPAAGDGFETAVSYPLIPGRYTWSFFVRSETVASAELHLQALGVQGSPLGETTVPVGRSWERVSLSFGNGRFSRDPDEQQASPVVLRATAAEGVLEFRVDGAVLEMNGGYSYAGTAGPTSWLPGHGYRASETLRLDALAPQLAGGQGSVAFWSSFRGGPQSWRTLFELGTHDRWKPHLQIAVRGARLALSGRTPDGQAVNVPVEVAAGEWHHWALVWGDGEAAAFLDGSEIGRLRDLDLPPVIQSVRLASAGPNAALNGFVDEACVYNRRLSAEEVASLAARAAPLSDEPWPDVVLQPLSTVPAIAHTLVPQPWDALLVNLGDSTWEGLTVTWCLGETVELERAIPVLAPGARVPIRFSFVADISLGHRQLVVSVRDGERELARIERRIEVTAMAEPPGNLQVLPWNLTAPRSHGFTCGGGHDVVGTMRDGLGWAPLVHYLGYPRRVDGADYVHGMNGQLGRARLDTPYMQDQIAAVGRRMAARYAGIPALRAVTLNSEMQWLWHHDFSPDRVAWVRERFGLDLTLWQSPPEEQGVNAFMTPYGRLRPSAVGMELPADRVIGLDEPLYAYHRWFHGPDGPTEALLNQSLSDSIHEKRPDVLTIQEPILRRPAVRAFDRMDIAQEWFYYEDPMRAVMVQERLNAAVRFTPLRMTGMPQFLFKKGGAAPYNAVPTGDLYHETAWLCALHPVRLFTYWNFGVVPSPDHENYYYRCMTKEQIDAFFGTSEPTWEEAQAALREDPVTARKMMPWTPGLIAAFERFHKEEIGPLGALIPRWRPVPRRMAVLRSFASQIYREVRWPHTTWLENCAVYSGVPFDVIYDEDFERAGDPLEEKDLLVVSRAVCLTRPAYERIVSFARDGGVVVVDPETSVDIPGAVVLSPDESFDAFEAALREREERLRQRVGNWDRPQFVEAMTELAETSQIPDAVPSEFRRLVETRVASPARSLTPNTWLNVLEADGATYIGIVNDLRVRGPMYGHFGKVREQGVPQQARLVLSPSLGPVAYDLIERRRVSLEQGEEGTTLVLGLPAAGGRVLVLLPRPVERMEMTASVEDAEWGDHRGRAMAVHARLIDSGGSAVPGCIPARLEITRPDGSSSDFSRHVAFRNGTLAEATPVLPDGMPGDWRIDILEFASGLRVSRTVRLGGGGL